MRLYVGTYTRPAPYLAATNGHGLYVYDFDPGSGHLTQVQEVGGIENPSYLCLSPDGRNLHAIWEVLDWPEGLVSSYAVDPSSGELTYLGVQGTRGSLACYVMMDSRSRVALVANYLSGSVAMFPAQADGSLGAPSSVDQHTGSGIDPARQEGPHAHCIVVTADDRFAFSADLGTDTIIGYRLDLDAGTLAPHSSLSLPPGSGPRHLVFAPDGRHAWVVCELASTIASLAYDAGTGTLSLIESYPMLPADFTGDSHCADIQVHPSGRFVYGSNRGHDSITMFAVDEATGRLRLLGHRPTEGRTPRNFTITPDGRSLLVANQDSDTVVVMPIDPETGLLGPTQAVDPVPTPVCLRWGP
ncbi:MAG: lactonase family protein [Chloroflexi bacterium]|nr:lactonase family protein [Chloroflexota bacterium]